MAKPITDPRWIATGKIAVPATPKQNEGFDTGERPPAQYFNWFMNLVYQWCLYLKTFGDHAQVFTETIEMDHEKVIENTIRVNVCLDTVKPVDIAGTGANTGVNGIEFYGTGSDVNVVVPLPSVVGYNLTNVKFWGNGEAGATSTDWDFIVKRVSSAGSTSDVVTDTTAPLPTGAFNDNFNVSTTKLAAGETLYLTLTSRKNSTDHGGALKGLSLTYDKEAYTP